VVVLCDLPVRLVQRLLERFPELEVVIAASSLETLPLEDPPGVRHLPVAAAGNQVLSLRMAPTGPSRPSRLELDDTVPDDEETLSLTGPVLDSVNRALSKAHRGVEPLPLPESFAGPEACATCHQEQHRSWSRGPHARATASLVRVERDWSFHCQTCHVTGRQEGQLYVDPARSARLAGVQCEVCHGPGAEHARAPSPGYGAVDPETCGSCHRPDAYPRFSRETAWSAEDHAPLVSPDGVGGGRRGRCPGQTRGY
jgi:hypothetical protein